MTDKSVDEVAPEVSKSAAASGFSSDEPAWLAAERAAASGAGSIAAPVSERAPAVEPVAGQGPESLAAAEPVPAVEPVADSVAAVEPFGAGEPEPATESVAAGEPDPATESVPDSVPGSAPVTAVTKASVADVEEAMKDVVDPELGINVVDLGLVYDAFVDDDNVVTLDMTLTSAACPLTDVIEDQTRQALTTGPGGGLVKDFRINWVWLPPWGPDKITDDGREQLRALGFNV